MVYTKKSLELVTVNTNLGYTLAPSRGVFRLNYIDSGTCSCISIIMQKSYTIIHYIIHYEPPLLACIHVNNSEYNYNN